MGQNKHRLLNKLLLFFLIIIIGVVCYAIIFDPWSLGKSPYGAGDYYYTDVEGFDFSKKTGTKYPLIFFTIFIIWSVLCWKFLKWLENK